jgi:CBS domain-containing protein
VDPLERIAVKSVMHTALRMVPADLSVEEALRVSAQPDGAESGLSLIADGGSAAGFVARSDLRKYIELGGDPQVAILRFAVPLSAATYPDEPMRVAADRLAQLGGLTLPVVDAGEPTHVVGFVSREGPFEARVLWLELERDRERTLQFPGARLATWMNARLHREP